MGVGAGFCMYDVVVNKSTFAISSADEFLLPLESTQDHSRGQQTAHEERRSSTSLPNPCRLVLQT